MGQLFETAKTNEMKTTGTRVYVNEEGQLILKPGDYGKNKLGKWEARPPGWKLHVGSLESHEVVENSDGTITVSPSILISNGDFSWHGYLKNGIWEEV